MDQVVTLELPEQIARHAQIVADRTKRTMEDVLVEWLFRSSSEVPVEMLDDAELLTLAGSGLDAEMQEELDVLLVGNREGDLTDQERSRLDQLMVVYRRRWVRKAQSLQIAVDRGLDVNVRLKGSTVPCAIV